MGDGSLPRFLDFTRPGREGIDEDKLPPFLRFWKRYFGGFRRLLGLNALCALVSLPVYVWITTLISVSSVEQGGQVMTVLGSILLSITMSWPRWLQLSLWGLSAVLLGPVSAAATYGALGPAWGRMGIFWSDIWEAFLANFKQALPVGLMDVLAMFATHYYLAYGEESGLPGTFRFLWLVLGIGYLLTRSYLYVIMVTVELPFGTLVKNSLLLALLKPWRPLVLLGIMAAGFFACLFADAVLIPFFLYGFLCYSGAYLAKPMVEEYLIKPAANQRDLDTTKE